MAIVTSIASACPSGHRRSRSYIMGSLPSSWEAHLYFGQAQLHKLLSDSIVGSLRFSAGHSIRSWACQILKSSGYGKCCGSTRRLEVRG
jgi:hypothetical protein